MDQSQLNDLQEVWNSLARTDPLWAVLSVPEKKGRKWDTEEFFREGRAEVDAVLAVLESEGYLVPHGKALDFGCGVGRLSQRLADYFDHVVGVDISSEMLALARKFNRQGAQVEYVHNSVDNLGQFGDRTFDFAYSNIVLQHMEPRYAVAYINEFFRLVKPGGFVVFQIPSHIKEEFLPSDYTETPMGERSCRAKLRLVRLAAPPAASQPFEAEVEIINASREDWTQRLVHQLNVGNHWLAANGLTMIVHDDGRSRLPGRLRSGETVTLPLAMRAPDQPGMYLLELDIVQEGIRWFEEAGSEICRVPIQVAPAPPLSAGGSQAALEAVPEPVQFIMRGLPKEEVLTLISAAGATLLSLQEHVTEWYSYKYFVRR
jgi:2-polyprenyl-3-methyl-5-hydroxy-6-metoxy-1,4-benzoquinol methylase